MTGPDVLCDGLGMSACGTCARNVDNHPSASPARRLTPAARPPKCADWKPLPFNHRPPSMQGARA